MKLLQTLPPEAHKGEFVSLDIEMFNQIREKLHRPHGDFACISVCYERDLDTVYQIYDTKDLRKLFALVKNGKWVLHNAQYDIRQLQRYEPIKPRFIWDIMLFEQSISGGYYQSFSLKSLVRRYLGVLMNKEVREDFSNSKEMTPEMKTYAAMDAVYTLKIAQIQRDNPNPGSTVYFEIDEPMIWPVLDMTGIPVNAEAWTQAVEGFAVRAKELQDELGVNVMSAAQVKDAAKRHGVHIQSTGAAILEGFKDNPFIAGVLEARMYRKATSTYGLKWLEEYVEADGKVYPSWHITGTETGRMSCISGSTILNTNRGPFRIEDYTPKYGDTILTHMGRHKPIIRKIYKGTDEFVQVECSNGSVVQCTLNHKLQTPNGWVEVRDLHLSSEVISNVNINSIRDQQREYQESPAHVFGGRPQVWLSANSGQYRNEVCQRPIYSEQVCRWGAQEYGAEHQDVSFKDGGIESGTSETSGQLHREDWGRTWIYSEEGERKVRAGTPESNGRSTRIEVIAEGTGSASHRREQTEQRAGQSSTCNSCGSSKVTYENTLITKITSLGTMDVWDIEVADDHSYCAGGLIHHNSSNPNGQNIPARKLPIFRTFFTASPGNIMTIADVSQQEPCILAFESKDKALTTAIKSGEDLHLAVARAIFDDPKMVKSDERRAIGKTINLGTSYGLSAPGLARKLNIDLPKAEAFLKQYFNRFGGVFSWIGMQRQSAYNNGFVRTSAGRRIYVNPYDYQWQNNAINSPIQGGAADFTKVWTRKYWENCRDAKIPYSLCLIVHDEIGTDAPKEIRRENTKALDEGFQEAATTLYPGIPFKYDMKMGKSWACKSLDAEAIHDAELEGML